MIYYEWVNVFIFLETSLLYRRYYTAQICASRRWQSDKSLCALRDAGVEIPSSKLRVVIKQKSSIAQFFGARIRSPDRL